MEDLSALIFVALAIAWAAYLIPKALQHHDAAARERSVDRFSGRMRVLAKRGADASRGAQLTLTAERPHQPVEHPPVSVELVETPHPVEEPGTAATPGERRVAAQVAAARRATRRRRWVLSLLVVSLAAVAGVAAYGLISWWYIAAPSALLLLWLVTCRVMVRRERRAIRVARRRSRHAARMDSVEPQPPVVEPVETPHESIELVETPAPTSPSDEPARTPVATTPGSSLWDPLPMTLPTYVTKAPAARRTVRTIDLDDTGVWTSGRTEADAALARQAEATDRSDRATDDETTEVQAVGS